MTRVVLTFTDKEFARVAGSASVYNLAARDYCKTVVMDAYTVVRLANSLATAAQCAENTDTVRGRPSDTNHEYRIKAEIFALAVREAYRKTYGEGKS